MKNLLFILLFFIGSWSFASPDFDVGTDFAAVSENGASIATIDLHTLEVVIDNENYQVTASKVIMSQDLYYVMIKVEGLYSECQYICCTQAIDINNIKRQNKHVSLAKYKQSVINYSCGGMPG